MLYEKDMIHVRKLLIDDLIDDFYSILLRFTIDGDNEEKELLVNVQFNNSVVSISRAKTVHPGLDQYYHPSELEIIARSVPTILEWDWNYQGHANDSEYHHYYFQWRL